MTASLSRRTFLAACGAAFVPGTLLAQGLVVPSAAGPMETMRAFYALPERGSKTPFLSTRLRRLYDTQQARSRRSGDVMPGLDFDFACGCQDYDIGFRQSLQLAETARAERTATISAKFKVFDRNSEIHFDLVRENGRWLIDNARGLGNPAWDLAALLRMR